MTRTVTKTGNYCRVCKRWMFEYFIDICEQCLRWERDKELTCARCKKATIYSHTHLSYICDDCYKEMHPNSDDENE